MEVVDDYFAELTRRLRAVLGEELVAVYAAGSYAMGAYEHGRSDIDVAVVVESPLGDDAKRAIVDALRHEALPCPAIGLELVVYARATAEAGTGAPGFELNLNTGARIPFRADFAPGDIEAFWFAIDRSILREHGRPLHGPPPAELFAPIPRATIAPCSRSRSAGTAATTRRTRGSTSSARSTSSTPATGSRSPARAGGLTMRRAPRSFIGHGQEEQAAQDAHPCGTAAEARAGELQAHGRAAQHQRAARRPQPAADPPPGPLS
jgi:hypothetical protein